MIRVGKPKALDSEVRLVVIGSSVVERLPTGQYTSKGQIVTYLHELRQFFPHVVWATTLYAGPPWTNTVLDTNAIQLVLLKGGWRGMWHDSMALNRVLTPRTAVLLFHPSPWLVPILGILRHRAAGLFVYIPTDYQGYANLKRRRFLGIYSQLYVLSYETSIRWAVGVIARGRLVCAQAYPLNSNVIETVPLSHRPGRLSLAGRVQLPCTNSTIRILYIGKVNSEKGVHILLQSFSAAKQALTEHTLRLNVVGSGSEIELMRQYADSLGIGDTVAFSGYVDDLERLEDYFAQSDILVVPSIYPEGVPRVIDEAIMNGAFVIATEVGGITAEYGNDILVKIPPNNSEALAQAILRLVLDDDFRQDIYPNICRRGQQLRNQPSPARQHAQFIMESLNRL